MRRKIIVSSIVFGIIAAAAVTATVVLTKDNETPPDAAATLGDNTNVLPQSVISRVSTFTPYYFANSVPPHNLQLDSDSITYSNGTLIIALVSPTNGSRVVITQQKLPEQLLESTIQGDENFTTPFGFATLSNVNDGRLTGSLATTDGTFILLNTNGAVESEKIKDVLRFLAPHSQ